eukprot:TRINITY_DN6946_c0_g1_i1.p1 TRINITY_DN6946_c0_g1~~TRINITY_DN6946_c0_g1_i1.p1  ORF type:complete len:517 (+),score=95.53 TRINITY_DN6946_c0_g1_i1:77-1627(+)
MEETSPTNPRNQSKKGGGGGQPAPLYRSKQHLSLVVLNATLGSFFMGYALGVFNTCQDNVADLYGWTKEEQSYYIGLISAMVPVGAAAGAITSGSLSNYYGRKRSMVITDILSIVGVLLTLPLSLAALMIGRIIVGFCAGINSALVPVYVIEMVTRDTKGLFGSFHQGLICTGILFGFLMGWGVPDRSAPGYLESEWWRVMFALPILFSGIRAVVLMTIYKYETPKFLAMTGQQEEAEKVIKKIYRPEYVNQELTSIMEEVAGSGPLAANMNLDGDGSPTDDKTSTYTGLWRSSYKKALIVGCMMSIFQQLSGINAVILYSTEIFKGDPHNPIPHAQTAKYTTMVGILNLLATILSGSLVEKKGRKSILLVGNTLIGVFLGGLLLSIRMEAYYFSTYCILAYVFAFGLSLGPLVWVIIPELLPAKGVSLATLTNWLFALLIAQGFPILKDTWLGVGGVFGLFFICTILCNIFMIAYLPETKGKSQAQIIEMMERGAISPGKGLDDLQGVIEMHQHK